MGVCLAVCLLKRRVNFFFPRLMSKKREIQRHVELHTTSEFGQE